MAKRTLLVDLEDFCHSLIVFPSYARTIGTYYKIATMTNEKRDFLLEKGFLFQIPTAKNLLTGAGAARSWPDNRGVSSSVCSLDQVYVH